LGKPRGRILELASGQCGVDPDKLHIGGPPVDNVAIDEEGSITLLKLVSLSAIIGLTLAYLSFRSIKITMMLFFTGGVAAMSSLAFVHYAGSTMDAILMSMPSLIYVLGLSGAVHIVNYYRDACHENGEDGAAEKAISMGWFPCTLAAFTTGLGLISLYTSQLTPIKKFGFFSAVATMATVLLLFAYLPASLHIWRPGYKKRASDERGTDSRIAVIVAAFWQRVGTIVVKHHKFVSVAGVLLLIFFGYGVTRIETTVQLLKLFDKDAKVLQDYRWMEENIGRLVPMEIVLSVDPDALNPIAAAAKKKSGDADKSAPTGVGKVGSKKQLGSEEEQLLADLRFDFLERMELSQRIRQNLENAFGPRGKDVVGAGMSTDVFVPLFLQKSQLGGLRRRTFNNEIGTHRQELLRSSDTLRLDDDGSELWRVSIRLAALNNVDYGRFVNELKTVVEPILSAYVGRQKLVREMQDSLGFDSRFKGRVLVLGTMPDESTDNDRDGKPIVPVTKNKEIDQSRIFANTFRDLLQNQGFEQIIVGESSAEKGYVWLDSESRNQTKIDLSKDETWKKFASRFDCVVIVDDMEGLLIPEVNKVAKKFVDISDYHYILNEKTKRPLGSSVTAAERKKKGNDAVEVTATYTGIVPIVYKAQRSLLYSLMKSIGLAFVMIAAVMMLLLANWRRRKSVSDFVNIPGGLLAMLPNVFPVILIFGAMGHLCKWFPSGNFAVDIGSMMTASVAMGVAVDDTIHFLNWYRQGLAKGLDRIGSIKLAYDRVATAMTQTTLIGGFGLSAFALSTFTPTQRFGVLMLFLLVAALVGDLIFLPAILAGPLGKFFGRTRVVDDQQDAGVNLETDLGGQDSDGELAGNSAAAVEMEGQILRRDSSGSPLRNHMNQGKQAGARANRRDINR
jgi:predicted RND superfamily exporter protein